MSFTADEQSEIRRLQKSYGEYRERRDTAGYRMKRSTSGSADWKQAQKESIKWHNKMHEVWNLARKRFDIDLTNYRG